MLCRSIRQGLAALLCPDKCESKEGTDGCGTAMDVVDNQEDRSTEKADKPEKPLAADSLQHREHSDGRGQAEHSDGIPAANRLHDLPPELCPESCSQSNRYPSLGAPDLLGGDANCGQSDKVK